MWIDQKFVVIEKILKNEEGSLLDLGSRDQILKKFLFKLLSYRFTPGLNTFFSKLWFIIIVNS